MDCQEWEEINSDTANRMLEHVQHFMSPVSRVLSDNEGCHLGTGAYLGIDGSTYLITNNHVAEHADNTPLAHQFFGSDSVIRLTNPLYALPYPIDVALCLTLQRHLTHGL